MSMGRIKQAGFVIGMISIMLQPITAKAFETGNLLINGDAEQHRCTDDWTAQSPIPGWQVINGAASVLCYTAFNYAHETPILPSSSQTNTALFAAPGADTAIEQIVNVQAESKAIDSGNTHFTLSAWLGGWRDRPERATLTAIFLDEDSHSTGAPVLLTNADAQARNNLTGLIFSEIKGNVPVKTRHIVITVNFLSGFTSYHNAYADNISLKLNGDVSWLVSDKKDQPISNIPDLDHVYVVMMENTNYSDVINTIGNKITINPQMPFLASLAEQGVILTNMWANYHPSDENYVAMVAGDTYKYGPVYYPDYNLPVTHLGDLLDARGKSWSAYVQNMKTPCNLNSDPSGLGYYAPDDQPFVHFTNIINDPTRCISTARDLTDFESAIITNTLPNFAWIAADGWWDGEGAWWDNTNVATSVTKQDEFLGANFMPLLASAQWKNSRSLLIITWDESLGWGWPDNRVPTIMIGSPGILKAGNAIDQHYDGYSVLRTIENAFGLDTLGRFDQFAEPLTAAFSGQKSTERTTLRTVGAAMRGSIADTFGQVTTPAAVNQGQPLVLTTSGHVEKDMVVNIEPLGTLPGVRSKQFSFAENNGQITIPTNRLKPGVYAAWLRRRIEPPHQAPVLFSVLSTEQIGPNTPGIEIVGAPQSVNNNTQLSVREASNMIVHYCRPVDAAPTDTWIGIFPTNTPSDQMTKDNANLLGYWLGTPGEHGQACGEAMAFSAELTPGQGYQILLFHDTANGTTTVGPTAFFTLTPALP